MLCKKPYSKGVMHYGCGQCTPCRINRSRVWTARMLLETYEHRASTFLTLTYNPVHCPEELKKSDLQNFFKRLRQEIEPRKIRYYAVGEYGEENLRPHYHAIVFGLDPTERDVVEKAWSIDGSAIGFVHLGTVSSDSITYTLGYMMKRLTKEKNGINIQPEFSLMSRQPGIGHGVVERILKAYKTEGGKAVLKERKWIEERFRSAGKNYVLGRYLKTKILEGLGFEKGNIEAHNELQEMLTWKEGEGKTTLQKISERQAKIGQQEGKVHIAFQKRRKV